MRVRRNTGDTLNTLISAFDKTLSGVIFVSHNRKKHMIYWYIRMSTDKQTIENQRFEIFKFADEKKLFFQLLD